LPETAKAMQEIILSADCFRGIRVKPAIPYGPWEIGLATIRVMSVLKTRIAGFASGLTITTC